MSQTLTINRFYSTFLRPNRSKHTILPTVLAADRAANVSLGNNQKQPEYVHTPAQIHTHTHTPQYSRYYFNKAERASETKRHITTIQISPANNDCFFIILLLLLHSQTLQLLNSLIMLHML